MKHLPLLMRCLTERLDVHDNRFVGDFVSKRKIHDQQPKQLAHQHSMERREGRGSLTANEGSFMQLWLPHTFTADKTRENLVGSFLIVFLFFLELNRIAVIITQL